MTFTIYSKNACPYCTKVKEVLRLTNQEFVEYKLGIDFTKDEFKNQFGSNATFPRVINESGLIGGCSETVKFLRDSGLV